MQEYALYIKFYLAGTLFRKGSYLIQTDAVKKYLIPSGNSKENPDWLAYAEEADILNVALSGFTAKAWRGLCQTISPAIPHVMKFISAKMTANIKPVIIILERAKNTL